MVITDSHPLFGAHLRAQRADIHLAEAQRLIRAFSESCKDHILTNKHGAILKLDGWPEIPLTLAMVVSDAVHNMRSALDYIVYEVARHDSLGQVQEGTQFPIEDFHIDPVHPNRGFHTRHKNYLKGLSDSHIAMIEQMQPYNGVDWTKHLRNISNPDKHRKLTALGSIDRSVMLSIHPVETGRFGPSTFKDGHNRDFVSRYDINLDAQDAIAIAGSDPDGLSLMRQLREIESEVFRTITAFAKEF